MSLKTRIKTLEDLLQQKENEIEALNKKDNPVWAKKRQKIEAGHAKVLGLLGNIDYLRALHDGEIQLPETNDQVTDSEAELLLSRSLALRDQVFEAHKLRSELAARLTENPVRKSAIEYRIAQMNDKLKGSLTNFHSMRAQLGLEWLDFDALDGFLKEFKKETKPRIIFLKETLE